MVALALQFKYKPKQVVGIKDDEGRIYVAEILKSHYDGKTISYELTDLSDESPNLYEIDEGQLDLFAIRFQRDVSLTEVYHE